MPHSQWQHLTAETLISVNAMFTSTLELSEVLERILDSIQQVVRYEVANIVIAEGNYFRVKASRGYAPEMREWLHNHTFLKQEMYRWESLLEQPLPKIISDTQKISNWPPAEPLRWIRAHIDLPIVFNNEVIGLINIDDAEVGAFDDQPIQELAPFAAQAAIAIHNAQLFDAERRQKLLAEALQATVIALTQDSFDLDEVLRQLILGIQRLLPTSDTIFISLIEGDNLRTVSSPTIGSLNVLVHDMKWLLNGLPRIKAMYESGQTVLLPDTHALPDWATNVPEHRDSRSYLATPLKLNDEVIGFINVTSNLPYQFTDEHINILESLAISAAATLRNARLYHQIDQERAQLSAILNGSGEGIIYTEENIISYVNRACCHILGWQEKELLGKPIYTLHKTLITSDTQFDTLQHPPELQVGQHEVQFRHRSGRTLDVSLTVSRISLEGEKTTRSVVLVRDITQEKQYQQRQTRFVTHAAHELRQPITNIMTRLYLMQKNPDDMQRHIPVLENSVARLAALTEHMAIISEFDLGRINIIKTEVPVQTLMAPVLQDIQSHMKELALTLKQDWQTRDLVVAVDIPQLSKALQLLFNHIFLYTIPGEEIHLNVSKVNADEALIEIEGGRLPNLTLEDNVQNIFQPFYMASEGKTVHTGLEMTIARHILSVHQGTIYVQLSDTGRTIFQVTLPRAV